ncbi:DUF397 domain-containing protein [Streptomyces cinnamoneus]|uniref:DUF397 domain-containing protein n=1 Tax=Streptomyces cinnamoneus TaxID=53446 RepID=UPI00341B2DF7
MSSPQWQKSSRCEAASSCIRVASSGGAIHLHESDARDVVLTTTPARLRPLISALKTNHLVRPTAHPGVTSGAG